MILVASVVFLRYPSLMFVPDIFMIAVLVTLGFTLGAVGVLMVYLYRQRQAVIRALSQRDTEQLQMTKQLATAIEATQRQQRQYEQQLQNIAQATLRLRQDVQVLSKRSERTSTETVIATPERVLH